jgi:hypothetical protein
MSHSREHSAGQGILPAAKAHPEGSAPIFQVDPVDAHHSLEAATGDAGVNRTAGISALASHLKHFEAYQRFRM